MDPVDGVHLLDERALTDDSANEVESKRRGVVPVARHHAANCDSF